MSGEVPFSFTTKINGDLFTVRGNTADEFVANTEAALGVIESVKALQQSATMTMAQAKTNITSVMPAETVEENGELSVIPDKYGNIWTYGRPDAPAHPIRNKYVMKSGKNKEGKPYKGWFDPCQGPLWSGGPVPKDDISAPIWEKTR